MEDAFGDPRAQAWTRIRPLADFPALRCKLPAVGAERLRAYREGDLPEDWAPPAATSESSVSNEVAESCPSIAGVYGAVGTLAPETPHELCETWSPNYEWALDWLCDVRLDSNLTYAKTPSSWLEIQQPDPDTLRILFGEPAAQPVVLSRSKGDFECKSDRISRKQTTMWRGPSTDSEGREVPGLTIFERVRGSLGVFYGVAGVRSLARSFYLSSDGSLVMAITRAAGGVAFFTPLSESDSTFVMWARRQASGTDDTTPPRNGQ